MTRVEPKESADALPAPVDEGSAIDSLNLVASVIDGRYLVERLVGSGGFGLVYRATHLHFASPVAIKVLRIPPFCTREERERFVARFSEEGRLAFNLGARHPGIVRILEAGMVAPHVADMTPYLAMEWLEGEPLTRLMARRRERGPSSMPLPEVLDLLELAVEGLSVAHRARIAHCDVKPANLFVCEQAGCQVVKVVDFGLAEVVTESVTGSYSSDLVSERRGFTSSYAAPEQWFSRLGRTGPWTDVHALALVCVELLCGGRAFQDRDPRKLMAACLDESVRPTPGHLGAPQAAAVERVFQKALAISTRARYRDAGEFWSALHEAAAKSSQSLRSPISRGASNPVATVVSIARTAIDPSPPTTPTHSGDGNPLLGLAPPIPPRYATTMNEEETRDGHGAPVGGDVERAAWVDAAVDRALARWPRIGTSKHELLRHVERLGEKCGDLARFGDELYLACSCLRGDPGALAVFEGEYVSRIAPSLARFRTDQDFVAEVIQLVRHKLLLPPDGRLGLYAATGPLLTWLRVVSVRTALGLRRSARRPEADLRAEHVLEVPRVDASDMPRYRQALDAAVGKVFKELPLRERNLLRLHYLDGVSLDRLARLYDVHRATIARWLADLRRRMLADIEKDVSERLRLSPSECRSVLGMLQSLLDASIASLLRIPETST
jgi:RNA polymerase sigma-70 factor